MSRFLKNLAEKGRGSVPRLAPRPPAPYEDAPQGETMALAEDLQTPLSHSPAPVPEASHAPTPHAGRSVTASEINAEEAAPLSARHGQEPAVTAHSEKRAPVAAPQPTSATQPVSTRAAEPAPMRRSSLSAPLASPVASVEGPSATLLSDAPAAIAPPPVLAPDRSAPPAPPTRPATLDPAPEAAPEPARLIDMAPRGQAEPRISATPPADETTLSSVVADASPPFQQELAPPPAPDIAPVLAEPETGTPTPPLLDQPARQIRREADPHPRAGLASERRPSMPPEPSEPPVIEVRIGSIEVVAEAIPAAPSSAQPPDRSLSLDEFLDGGAG